MNYTVLCCFKLRITCSCRLAQVNKVMQLIIISCKTTTARESEFKAT